MFTLVHSKQEKGYRDKGLANIIQTSPSFTQQEYRDGIILPKDKIIVTVRDRQAIEEEEDTLGIISKDINQTN